MMTTKLPSPRQSGARGGFTLIEALVVAGIIALLAAILLPVLGNVKGRGYTVVCFNNERQLALAWNLYADDREGYLPYNYGTNETYLNIANGQLLNWANNVMTWGLEPDITNTTLLARGGIGPYLGGMTAPFRCPADRKLSDDQRLAGWRERGRSYSMNAMVGHPGAYLKYGKNINNPKHKQFIKMQEIANPSGIFIFIDEHPDSINDGYFLNKPGSEPPHWYDLPGSYHNRGANLAFGDLHVEYRKWVSEGTVPDKVKLPAEVPLNDTRDYDWLMQRTSLPYSY